MAHKTLVNINLIDDGTEPNAGAAKVERLKDELAQEHDRYLRVRAEFDNYRKRVERDRVSDARRGRRDLILGFLDIADGFERAILHADEAPTSYQRGLQALQQQMLSLLRSQGVTPFDSVGKKFDPNLHDAVSSAESNGIPPGTVVEEMSRGYQWGDEIIRHAKVRVAR